MEVMTNIDQMSGYDHDCQGRTLRIRCGFFKKLYSRIIIFIRKVKIIFI